MQNKDGEMQIEDGEMQNTKWLIFSRFSANTTESRLLSSSYHEIFLPRMILKWAIAIEQIIVHDPDF